METHARPEQTPEQLFMLKRITFFDLFGLNLKNFSNGHGLA
jgi:hypothetical protein